MGKRIAVFSTPWSGEHIGGILKGIKRKAFEKGIDVFIFNNYSGYVGDKEFNDGEHNILRLPRLDLYDGILLIMNSVSAMDYVNDLIGRAMACQIPYLSIDQELEGAQFIGTDNYKAMAEMVEHLIVEHHCRTINYLGGPKDHGENSQRRRAYIDTLTKHGIMVEERRIVNFSFLRGDGERAYVAFEKEGVERPDAVVCANDEMACGYVNALNKRGYEVPRDVRVTGFDYSPYGRNFYPEIASVERSCENLGYAAVACILDMMDGKDIPERVYASHRIRPNTSCGCFGRPEDYAKQRVDVLDKQRWMDQSRWNINIMQRNMLVCETEAQFRKAMNSCLDMFHIHNICVMVDEQVYEKEFELDLMENRGPADYPERMRLLYWNRRPEHMGLEYVDTEKLVPDDFLQEEGAHICLAVPVHLNGMTFGYAVMEDGIDNIVDGNLFYIVNVINTTIRNIRQSNYIRKINERLQRMSMIDAMTGVYNRFALKELGEPLLRRNVEEGKGTVFLFADMDGLKMFNDTFGHDMGDEAIKALAEIMMHAFGEECFCVRYGGDEFLLMGSCESEAHAVEMKQAIQDRIRAFNEKELLPRNLSASLGYVFADGEEQKLSIEHYISKADEMMYQIKKQKKESRRS